MSGGAVERRGGAAAAASAAERRCVPPAGAANTPWLRTGTPSTCSAGTTGEGPAGCGARAGGRPEGNGEPGRRGELS